jgi:UDP-glucose 4-epimerase
LKNDSRVVYASTWEVYGQPEYQPIDETHPTRPDHPYNITKLAGESLLLAACRLNGISAMALRLGTAYGPGLRANSVFRVFIDRARDGMPITIQGDGSQARQFTHASDIARAFVLAANSTRSGIPLNIVDPRLTTIRELAELVSQNIPTELTFGEARPGDVPSSYVSADAAKKMLGWTPEVLFEDGLMDLINGS